MTSLDRRAADLQELVQDILKQFQYVNASAANGPHVELNMQELRVVEFLGNEGPRMMREVAQHQGVPAYMVDNASELDPAWVAGKERVGVTAGASAPEVLVMQLIDRLKQLGAAEVAQVEGIVERVVFPLPKSLA